MSLEKTKGSQNLKKKKKKKKKKVYKTTLNYWFKV